MSRLATLPYEIGPGSANGFLEAFKSTSGTGTVAVDNSVFSAAPSRGSYKCTAVAGTDTARSLNDIVTTLGRRYYHRVRFRVSALPTNTTKIILCTDGASAAVASLRLTSTGKLQLWNDVAGTQIGSDSTYTVTSNTWFRADLSVLLGTGAIDVAEARVEGTVIATASSLSLSDQVIDYFQVGLCTAPGNAMSIWTDDGAINDDQGASENGYPGDCYVALMKPTGDSSNTGWTNGSGTTSALWDAVDNTPPVGVAVGSSTIASQIKSTANNITDNYVATIESYTTAGVPAGSTVVLVQALTAVGGSTTTAQSYGLTIASNPSGGVEKTGSGPAAIAGTWDASWGAFWTDPMYAPSVTLGTAPTLKIRKNTTGTATRTAAFMGMVAEVALPSTVVPPQMRPVLQAVNRAANW